MALFTGLRWREARGDVLRKEIEDLLAHLSAADETVGERAIVVFLKAVYVIDDEYGPLSNLSGKTKRAIAKKLSRDARIVFDRDAGGGHGLALMSIYIEAQTIPGEDAAFVLSLTQKILVSAQEKIRDGR